MGLESKKNVSVFQPCMRVVGAFLTGGLHLLWYVQYVCVYKARAIGVVKNVCTYMHGTSKSAVSSAGTGWTMLFNCMHAWVNKYFSEILK
jgi:hypothetical protein